MLNISYKVPLEKIAQCYIIVQAMSFRGNGAVPPDGTSLKFLIRCFQSGCLPSFGFIFIEFHFRKLKFSWIREPILLKNFGCTKSWKYSPARFVLPFVLPVVAIWYNIIWALTVNKLHKFAMEEIDPNPFIQFSRAQPNSCCGWIFCQRIILIRDSRLVIITLSLTHTHLFVRTHIPYAHQPIPKHTLSITRIYSLS